MSNVRTFCVAFRVASGFSEDKDCVAIVLQAAVSETSLKLNNEEELFLWGAAIRPKFGLNSKLDLEDLRARMRKGDY